MAHAWLAQQHMPLTLIPVQSEPLEVSDHGLFRLAGGASSIGVLHPDKMGQGAGQ